GGFRGKTSATLQAWATQPRGGKGASASQISLIEYQSILTSLDHLPGPDETQSVRVEERHREKEGIKRRLAALTETCPAAARRWRSGRRAGRWDRFPGCRSTRHCRCRRCPCGWARCRGSDPCHILESGQIQLHYEAGSFLLTYFDRRFLVSPQSA